MSRFYFNVHGAEELPDREGVELLNLKVVKVRAIKEARSLMSADVLGGEIRIDRHFQVTDDAGAIMLILPFAEACAFRGNR